LQQSLIQLTFYNFELLTLQRKGKKISFLEGEKMNMLGSSKFIIAAALVAALSSTAFAKEKVYKWKLATTWGPTLSPFIDAPRNLAKMVKEMSNGRLIIRVDASNKHKSAFGILDMVKGGQYDMGHSASYYWK
jgi:TRAP-type mannitol/chloroaromatic compound transport system substrate-binding protein